MQTEIAWREIGKQTQCHCKCHDTFWNYQEILLPVWVCVCVCQRACAHVQGRLQNRLFMQLCLLLCVCGTHYNWTDKRHVRLGDQTKSRKMLVFLIKRNYSAKSSGRSIFCRQVNIESNYQVRKKVGSKTISKSKLKIISAGLLGIEQD